PLNPLPSNIPLTATVKVTGVSGSGGSITCTSCSTISVDASGSGTAGNILLAAFSKNVGTGSINLTGIDLSTANSSGKAGNVTIIAGGPTITVGNVDMSGTKSGAKFLAINAQPKGTLTAKGNGSTSGSLTAGVLNPAGTITVDGSIDDAAGVVTLTG